MDVYEFLNLATDLSGVYVTVYDMNSGLTVFREPFGDPLTDMDDNLLNYEVESYDIYKDDDNVIHLELNISMEEDD